MMAIAGFFLCMLAFVLFGLTNDEHHRRWLGRRPDKERKLRLKYAASLALVAAFFVTCAGLGWVMGPVIWSGEIMLAAGLIFLSFNFAPASKKD
ncbi:MAG: DUF3325 domain-containing protein [Sphingobium sp.]|nr:DUF3325 domain-containing protein [Sphingobium sp.]